jgi:MYXO-CTERM domain-containing protein
MFRNAVGTMSCVVVSLVLTSGSIFAQDANNSTSSIAAPDPRATSSRDRGFDYGWLGLIGLGGLAGLMRRDRETHRQNQLHSDTRRVGAA